MEAKSVATVQLTAVDKAKIIEGLKRLLPVIEMIARLSPNKFDDAAVEFLKLILTSFE